MSEPILGSGVIIEMLDGLNYYPILCGETCAFTRTPEIIETSSPDSGLFKDFMIRREEWGMSVSGLTKILNDTVISFFYMLQTSIRRVKKSFRITFTDPAGNDIQISGDALIGSESITGDASDFAKCSIELKGTGPFAIGSVTPPVVGTLDIYSDYWVPGAGHDYVDGSSSGTSPSAIAFGGVFNLGASDTLLDVEVDGDHFNLITSGAPGNGECKFNTSTFVLTFAADMIFDGTQRVWIEFQRV